MSTFDRWFTGLLLFAVVNFAWITFIEQYVPLSVGTALGVVVWVCFGLFGPKKK